jgi:hypothetical protein
MFFDVIGRWLDVRFEGKRNGSGSILECRCTAV